MRVSYHYGFSDGHRRRRVRRGRSRSRPRARVLHASASAASSARIADALAAWQQAEPQPRDAVIEITDSARLRRADHSRWPRSQSLQLRAANRTRPVIRLLDWQTDLPGRPDGHAWTAAAASRSTALLVTGRGAQRLRPGRRREGAARCVAICGAHVRIRHCTLVPGWTLDSDCEPRQPEQGEPRDPQRARARARSSTASSGRSKCRRTRCTRTRSRSRSATASSTRWTATARRSSGRRRGTPTPSLTVRRTTVFGIVQVHAIELAENSIFTDCVHVARRQLGCMRFCYVPAGCRTPRRFHCQPDLASSPRGERRTDPADVAGGAGARGAARAPAVHGARYGTPAYASCAASARARSPTGADDGAEMGVFHDLFQPQRLANCADAARRVHAGGHGRRRHARELTPRLDRLAGGRMRGDFSHDRSTRRSTSTGC